MGNDNNIGCGVGLFLGALGLLATLSMGPIDFTRTVYNQIIGDMPVLKRELLGYCRDCARREYEPKAELDTSERAKVIEYSLAKEFDILYNGNGLINPNDVSIGKLWDYIEAHPKHWFDKWVWP